MLGFRESLQKLENSEEFKSYKKHNPDSYVINMIYLDEIEFNFFSPKTKQSSLLRKQSSLLSSRHSLSRLS